MTNEQAEHDRLALCDVLNETAQLLRNHGESHWAAHAEEWLRLVTARDIRGVDLARSSFGGMGSFNDLIIHPMNGHEIQDSEVDRVNNRLQELQTSIYELTRGLAAYSVSDAR
jgi:hypothetical protein